MLVLYIFFCCRKELLYCYQGAKHLFFLSKYSLHLIIKLELSAVPKRYVYKTCTDLRRQVPLLHEDVEELAAHMNDVNALGDSDDENIFDD